MHRVCGYVAPQGSPIHVQTHNVVDLDQLVSKKMFRNLGEPLRILEQKSIVQTLVGGVRVHPKSH